MALTPLSADSFKCRKTLQVGSNTYEYFSLPDAEKNGLPGISKLPQSLKVLLENLLRYEDGRSVKADDIRAMAEWLTAKTSQREIAYRPARVLMQDFTGVPAIVDLAAMRDAMKTIGGEPQKINPLVPVDLVIDHSVMVDHFGTPQAFKQNVDLEYERNKERYEFLRWGGSAFNNFQVVPPGTGICHQVNLEYLAQTVWTKKVGKVEQAFPDTCVGTDSHTTMVNGLSVLGWGVGGIEAEAAMLGQPVAMVIPEVIGFRLKGRLKEGITATDLVLTCTQMLRKRGVVEKFVEFFGDGLDHLIHRGSRHHRQHGARIRRHLRLLPDRRRHHQVSACHRPQGRSRRAGRSLREGAGHVARAWHGARCSPTSWSSTSRPSSPPWPDPSVRRTAFRLKDAKAGFAKGRARDRQGCMPSARR